MVLGVETGRGYVDDDDDGCYFDLIPINNHYVILFYFQRVDNLHDKNNKN